MHIPISEARRLAKRYGFDQIIILGRKVESHENVVTYGIDRENCKAAAKIGDFLKNEIMQWWG